MAGVLLHRPLFSSVCQSSSISPENKLLSAWRGECGAHSGLAACGGFRDSVLCHGPTPCPSWSLCCTGLSCRLLQPVALVSAACSVGGTEFAASPLLQLFHPRFSKFAETFYLLLSCLHCLYPCGLNQFQLFYQHFSRVWRGGGSKGR